MGASTSGLSGTAARCSVGVAGLSVSVFFSAFVPGLGDSGFALTGSTRSLFGVAGRSGWFTDAVEERRASVALEPR